MNRISAMSRRGLFFGLCLGTAFNLAASAVHASDWTATASSTEGGLEPGLAIDGDTATRWSSTWNDGQWWAVDFGAPVEVRKIVLQWEAAYAARYDVSVSQDGTTWSQVFSETNGNGASDVIAIKPQTARAVRIDLRKRATQWGFSLLEVEVNPPEPLHAMATASSGSDEYGPQFAIDGDMSTRWGSGFNDDDWWQAEFDQPINLAGLKFSWETAFGEKYLVQVSPDGADWKTVYDVDEGDGRTDILYFGPVATKFVRMKGIQRGTGWGYSLFEVNFIEAAKGPVVTADSADQTHPAALIIDGDRATAWHSAGDGTNTVVLTLPAKQDIGGIELTWGKDFAAAYSVDVTADGQSWKTVHTESEGNGARDYVFFGSMPAKALRIRCERSAAGNGFALAQVELKSGEEQATPIRYYQALSRDAKRGLYPMWLGREQEYWTILGLPEDTEESLLGETGVFEPYKTSFCVIPMIIENGQAVTWAGVARTQSLDDDYLPMPLVRWQTEGWALEISAVACGEVDASSAAVRYRFTNTSDKPYKGQLALGVLPVQLNPVWQNGGFSPIRKARYADGVVEINGRPQIRSLVKPDAGGVSTLRKGDAVQSLAGGKAPSMTEAEDAEGLVSAGLLYNLDVAGGAHQDVVLVFPLHTGSTLPNPDFEKLHAEQKAFWQGLLDRFSIEIPQQRLIRMMKSNLAYILINKDGPWTKPGSRNYAHSWIRDGECTSVAMMRLGLTDQARNYIKAYTPFIDKDGWVPHLVFEGGKNSTIRAPTGAEGNEYDSLGLYVALVRQYVDFTGDDELLKAVYPTAVQCLKFGQGLRRERMTDEYKKDPAKRAYYGILPQSNSHEGYYPAKHSYWDDYWFLRGLRDGIHLANRLGRKEDAAWMEKELADFDKCLRASILAVIQRDHLDTIPGCVEKGDFDATSTAIAISDCGAKADLPQPYGQTTFDKYFESFSRRLQPGVAETFTPYEVRTSDAFIKLGQRDRALTMLTYFSEVSSRPPAWNHLAEVVHANARAPSYLGDMPHTWVGAGYINAVRSLFAYEEENQLVLAAGVPAAWLLAGVTVKDLPTQFGDISYTLARKDGSIRFNAEGAAQPPGGFRVELPSEYAGWRVTVNGVARKGGAPLTLDRLPAAVELAPPAP